MNNIDNTGIRRFEKMDLCFWSVLAFASEYMANALLGVYHSGFYFSFSIVICLMAMLRWGAVGIVVGIIGGLPGFFFSEMPWWSGLLFYGLANAFLAVPMLMYGRRDRDRIVDVPLGLSLYVLGSHICLAVGKGIVIFLLTGELTGAVDYFGATFLVLIINMIVCLVLKKRDGLICDMRNYFAREED